MGYSYEKERSALFTEEGLDACIRYLDRARTMVKVSGTFQEHKLWEKESGDSWFMLAVTDFLVEHGYLTRIYDSGVRQNWVYTTTVK